MMTEDIYGAVCEDDADKLQELMGVGRGERVEGGVAVAQRPFHPGDWEGHQIWPRRSRRMTILQLAVREGSLSVVKMLVSAGLSLNYGEAGTALVTALEYEQLDSLQLLIKLGSDVNKRLTSGYGPGGHLWWNYPIAIAVRCSSPKPLEMLLHNGADPLVQFPLPEAHTLNAKPLMVTSFTPALRRARHDCRFLALLLKAIPCLDGSWTWWNPIPESVWFELHQIFYSSISSTVEQTELDTCIAWLMLDLGFRIPEFPQDIGASSEIKQYFQTPQTLKQICRFNIRRNYRLYDMTSLFQSQHVCHSDHVETNKAAFHNHKENGSEVGELVQVKTDSVSASPENSRTLSEGNETTQDLGVKSDIETDQPDQELNREPLEHYSSPEKDPSCTIDDDCTIDNNTRELKPLKVTHLLLQDNLISSNEMEYIVESASTRSTDNETESAHSEKILSPSRCEDVQTLETVSGNHLQHMDDNSRIEVEYGSGCCQDERNRIEFVPKVVIFPKSFDESDNTVSEGMPVSESLSLNSLDKLQDGNTNTAVPEKSTSESKLHLLPVSNILVDNMPQERSQSLPPDVSNEVSNSNSTLVKRHMERSLSSPVECGVCLDSHQHKEPSTQKDHNPNRPLVESSMKWSSGERCPFWQVLDTLPLPTTIINYLKFQEL